MYLVVGLGNIGEQYNKTRHNAGFEVLDKFLEHTNELEHAADKFVLNRKLDAMIADVMYKKSRILLLKPVLFMNNSGISVRKGIDYYNLDMTDLIVIHDDIDLPLGAIRLKKGGGAGGHHGLESIINQLGYSDFIRLRMGVGRLKMVKTMSSRQGSDFVLKRLTGNNKKLFELMNAKGAEALDCCLQNELSYCMGIFNAKKISGDLPMED